MLMKTVGGALRPDRFVAFREIGASSPSYNFENEIEIKL